MRQFTLLDRLRGLPPPYDADRAATGFQHWAALAADAEPALADFIRALPEDPRGRALLAALFGNSPYLTELALREPAFLARLLEQGPAPVLAAVMAETAAAAALAAPELMSALRLAKRRVALAAAIADIGQLWPVAEVTAALTDFAEAALGASVARLLADAAAAGEIRLPHPGDCSRDSGFVVIGMGKLGARELNYSSDIDLLILYDPETIDYIGSHSPQDCYVRIARGLVKMLQERTADGYVFRTDLRLRPDPAATPVALSMTAAENYYESLGQNWERAAMIKARPVAGDVAAGRAFLDRIGPFVWRKYLDFAAIEDIHSIKRQIHVHKGHGAVAVAGHNIKVGRGGIREIEFFAQTQQLIAGGRDRRLRRSGTCAAIGALADTGRLAPAIADELVAAYEFLRRLEHRLQMIADEQTHTLPDDPAGLHHVATFFGMPESGRFVAEVHQVLERVQRHYAALFEAEPSLGTPAGSLVFTGTEDDPETLRTLARLGFSEPASVAATIRGWHHGRYRAMRSERAREKLTAIMPRLLEALSRAAHPDVAFSRFDEFLARLPAGVQLFSLLHANPHLLDLVAELMGTAPRLADYLSRNPALFDGIISADLDTRLADADGLTHQLESALEPARDFQDVLDLARRWCNDRRLQIGLQLLRGVGDAEAAGFATSDLAEAVLRALLPRVEAEFAVQHGRVAGGALAIIGLGRLGSREMTLESDLDLIFVYGHAPDAEASDGPRPLAPAHYFARLSQRVINALTALTPDGRLFEVDMRLRPSGHAGPVATSLAAFARYQRESAWTWEHMALTRARVVAGPPRLVDAIREAIRAVLTAPRDPDRLLADVATMRQRVAAEHAETDPWAVKHVRGGLIDAEFICQYLQLRHAARSPEVLEPHTLAALRRLAAAGALDAEAARDLADAVRLLSDILALTRLCQAERFRAAEAPRGLKATLARAAGVGDFAALEARLVEREARVRALYEALVEAPAQPHLAAEPDRQPA
jgi:glutamate-ammonia-ligase adenylyltransferase